jgi:ribosomal protein S27AE
MLLDIDLPDGVAVEETREHLIVEGQRFAKRELRCQDCHSTNITAHHYDQHRVDGIDAVAIGTVCDRCGSDQLHMGY